MTESYDPASHGIQEAWQRDDVTELLRTAAQKNANGTKTLILVATGPREQHATASRTIEELLSQWRNQMAAGGCDMSVTHRLEQVPSGQQVPSGEPWSFRVDDAITAAETPPNQHNNGGGFQTEAHQPQNAQLNPSPAEERPDDTPTKKKLFHRFLEWPTSFTPGDSKPIEAVSWTSIDSDAGSFVKYYDCSTAADADWLLELFKRQTDKVRALGSLHTIVGNPEKRGQTQVIINTKYIQPPPDGNPRHIPVAKLEPIAQLIDTLHTQGMMHGDIKPANLVTTQGGRLAIIDWETLSGPEFHSTALGTEDFVPDRGATLISRDRFGFLGLCYEALGRPGSNGRFKQAMKALTDPETLDTTDALFAEACKHLNDEDETWCADFLRKLNQLKEPDPPPPDPRRRWVVKLVKKHRSSDQVSPKDKARTLAAELMETLAQKRRDAERFLALARVMTTAAIAMVIALLIVLVWKLM